MLLVANIKPASATNIHQTCNKVCKIITDVNKNSMKKIRQVIQELNEKCGLANTPIRAERDARYNNATFSAIGKTPFQAATQVTYTLSENVTKKKNVMAVFCGNKLCKKGTHLRAKGKEVTCPGHEDCTATIPPETTIGDEKRSAAECISELQSDDRPLVISHFTSDGDSAAVFGASEKQGHMIENLKDLCNFFDSQRKQTAKAPFSSHMFPGRTKAMRESMQRRFALDLKLRCRTEYENCFKHFSSDLPLMK
uniref:Mutator-like transposase domain-containing protein n=1 Tax=Magallana gigas TaxID=29159 RepID=K1Q8E3_MAGGI